MTTTTPAVRAARMPGLGRLVATEFRLYLRDAGTVVFVLAFPAILLVGMGLVIPGFREVITDAPPPWEGMRGIHIYAPVVVCVAVATAGLSALPTYLASYRESGVLRRLSTTPMPPQGILLGQLTVNLVGLTAGAAIAIGLGAIVLDVPMPANWGLALVSFVLAITSVFGIGLIIGGLVDKASTASGIGMLVFFPLLFFAGMWTPGPMMPGGLASIAQWVPLGAAAQALTAAWFGGDPPLLQLGVMAAWSLVLFVVAARTFRWR